MKGKEPADAEGKEPADGKETRPANAERSVDVEVLADTENLVVICYIHQY